MTPVCSKRTLPDQESSELEIYILVEWFFVYLFVYSLAYNCALLVGLSRQLPRLSRIHCQPLYE